jgi:uncharacterized protein YbbC (DUF1343 family)
MNTVTSGLEKLLANPPRELRGRRLGLLTNPSGIDRRLRSSVNLIAAHPALGLTALYGPEHGVRGSAQAGEHVDAGVDPVTGLPAFSLYGDSRSPTAEMLEPIDTLVIDLQDIGVRYATYLSTVALVLDACARHGKDVMILDRPNPLGGVNVAGNILEPAFASFVGTHTIPILHGLTIGEFGRLWARDRNLTSPAVVTMDGWSRHLWYDQTGLPWVFPSPNLPTPDSVTLYPATCLIEGTILSEGRGTTRPFELIGAPWIDPEALANALNAVDMPEVGFRPATFTPTFSKHQGVPCGGVQIHIVDREALDTMRLGLTLLATVKALYADDFAWLPQQGERHFIDLLAGSASLRETIDRGDGIDDLLAAWVADADAFRSGRSDILLYR